MNKKIIASLLATTIFMSGCATTNMTEKIEKTAAATQKSTDAYLKELDNKKDSQPLIEKSQEAWFAGKAFVHKKSTVSLPEALNRQITIERYLDIQEAAERITIKTGIPIKIDNDLLNPSSNASGQSSAPSSGAPSTSFGPTGAVSGVGSANQDRKSVV